MLNVVNIGTGSYIPSRVITAEYFAHHTFYDSSGALLERQGLEAALKLLEISAIRERHYADSHETTSSVAAAAGHNALQTAKLNASDLDHIIIAHNFGDVTDQTPYPRSFDAFTRTIRSHFPGYEAEIEEVIFGCPGYVYAISKAADYIREGRFQTVMTIGAEVMSRIVDAHDRDCMILADAGAAALWRGIEMPTRAGVLSYRQFIDQATAQHIRMGPSYGPQKNGNLYFHMDGQQVFEFAKPALKKVIMEALESEGLKVSDIDLLLAHQANNKITQSAVKGVFHVGKGEAEEIIRQKVPVLIDRIGNTSGASTGIIGDLVRKGKLDGYAIPPNGVIAVASVGSPVADDQGMRANAILYREP